MDGATIKVPEWAMIWRFLKRFWLLILCVSVFSGAAGFLYARFLIKPTYEATALIFAWPEIDVNIPDQETSSARSSGRKLSSNRLESELALAKLRSFQLLNMQLTVGNLLLPDFQAILKSQKLRQRMNKELESQLGDRFDGKFTLSANPLAKTRFVEIAVRCRNKEITPAIIAVAVKVFSEEARELLGIDNTQVIDISKVGNKVSPREIVYLLAGLFFGCMICGGICFLVDYLDKSIRDFKDLEDTLHLPVLGVLPFVNGDGDRNEGLFDADHKSMYGEAIRSLRVNIEYLLPETGGAKVFLITSVSKSEGKSSVMSSLSAAFAKIEKKVLLVDADLRRPHQHRIFKLSNKVGLVDMLVSKIGFDDLVQRNVLPGLDVLTVGTIPMTPSDLLASRRLEEFLRAQSQNYDYIFIDAPPALGFADPMILGKLADSTIITCDFKSANIDKLRIVVDRLRKSNIRLGGVVVNRFLLQNRSEYYYGYQHYYYQYQYQYAQDGNDFAAEEEMCETGKKEV